MPERVPPGPPPSPTPSVPASRWRRLSRSPARAVAVGVLGAVAGAAYAHFIGCRTGTCPITSNVWVAAAYGGAVGAFVSWPGRSGTRREARP